MAMASTSVDFPVPLSPTRMVQAPESRPSASTCDTAGIVTGQTSGGGRAAYGLCSTRRTGNGSIHPRAPGSPSSTPTKPAPDRHPEEDTHPMHQQIDAAALRALQTPLKELYLEDPHEAATPVSARADWRDPGITTSVDAWSGRVRAGLHRATGGDGSDACSGDMLLEAVLACAGVTMRSVATSMGLTIHGARLHADAEFDARGTLGIDRSVPVGVSPVTITAVLDTDASDDELTRLARSTERHCVVGQSLAVPPTVTVTRRSTR